MSILKIESMKNFRILDPLELEEIRKDKDKIYEYIDKLHMILKDYQLVFDSMETKNLNLNNKS